MNILFLLASVLDGSWPLQVDNSEKNINRSVVWQDKVFLPF